MGGHRIPFYMNLHQMVVIFYQHHNFQIHELMAMLERSSKDWVVWGDVIELSLPVNKKLKLFQNFSLYAILISIVWAAKIICVYSMYLGSCMQRWILAAIVIT